MTLTNEPTLIEAAPSLHLKLFDHDTSTVTFNTTSSDDSDSYDEYEEVDDYLDNEKNVNSYDFVSIVVDQGVKHEAWSKPSFANVLRSNMEEQQTQETQEQRPRYIKIKPKKNKNNEDERPELDLDSISFVGHSYYNSKGHSYIARQQSLRKRPDEERRRDCIKEKKDKQREGISTKKEKKLRFVRRE